MANLLCSTSLSAVFVVYLNNLVQLIIAEDFMVFLFQSFSEFFSFLQQKKRISLGCKQKNLYLQHKRSLSTNFEIYEYNQHDKPAVKPFHGRPCPYGQSLQPYRSRWAARMKILPALK